MKFENEITVKVNCSYEELTQILKEKGFIVSREYKLKDSYMFPKGSSLENKYQLLSDYLIVRNVDNKEFQITHKYKEYDKNGDITKQGKTNCGVYSEESAIQLLEEIGYQKLFVINNEIKRYEKGEIELIAAKVNNEYICIEYEQKGKSIEEVIKQFKQFGIPYDESEYFLKKAFIELQKIKNQ